MVVAADKERLIADVARLRKAERGSTDTALSDIAAARGDLESMIGTTITRAMAARLLGVSQTALERWIAAGDVPALITRTGRPELPLRALVELIEAVENRRVNEPEDRHPLGSVLRLRRSRAARLGESTPLISAADLRDRGSNGHREAELRSLAYHRAVAVRLDESVIRDAHERLARWLAQGRIHPHYAGEWQRILGERPPRIAQLIAQDTELMRDLRQSSPFAGTLNEPERRRVLAIVDETLA